MQEMYDQWRKDLIEAGKLKPDEEIDNIELSKRWQKLQVEKIKSGSFTGLSFSKGLSMKPKSKPRRTDDSEIDIREGIKQALNALMTKAKGASYCMIVVDKAWINFRYKKSKKNLHLQVAGNKYIAPLKLKDSDIKHLEDMDIPPEPMSDEIYARDFDDDEQRNLDKIVGTAIEIFKEVYHVSDRDSARVELDLGKGETEEILNSIAPFFKRRSGKKFKWDWHRSV
ncbi:MAG: hypothetical protein RTU63_03110 [Candidatus Thorarchaeota archaeon]